MATLLKADQLNQQKERGKVLLVCIHYLLWILDGFYKWLPLNQIF